MAKDNSRKNEFRALAVKKLEYWREHYPHIDTLMEREPVVVREEAGMAHFMAELERQQRVGFDLETYSDDEMVEAEMQRLGVKWEVAKKACNLCAHRGAAAWAIFTMGDTEQTWLLDLPRLTGIQPPKPEHKADSTVRRPCPPALAPLKEWFESSDRAVIYGANLVFDWRFLFGLGIYPSRTRVFDVQNAHHLLTAGDPSFEASLLSLQHLAGIHLKLYVPKDEQGGDWGEELTRSKLSYMHGDGVTPLRVGEIQRKLILRDRPKNGHGLATVTNISMAGIFAFAEMQYVGCPFNDEKAVAQERAAHAKEAECRKTMERSASAELLEKEGRRLQFNLAKQCEVNFASPTQCIKFFKRLGIPISQDPKTGNDSIDADLLKQLEDPTPFITDYLIWKDAITEVKAWKTYRSSVNPVTGRIHANFKQLGTDSGRSSCQAPNLQNPSRKAGIRECVEENEGRELGVMDYSQMEVVIMTGECRCPEMLRVNQSKADFHYNTAERVLGKPKAQISKGERNNMKPLCFGLLYGMQAKQLVGYAKSTYNVTFTVEEAVEKGERFFSAYPGLKAHHDALRDQVRKIRYPGGWGEKDESAQMVARAKSGRRRVLWGSNLALQAAANQPVQGLGADIAVLAMGRLRSALDNEGLDDCFLVNFVHDELCVSAPAGKGERVLPVLQKVMIDAALEFYPDLNFGVEGSVAQSWSEAK